MLFQIGRMCASGFGDDSGQPDYAAAFSYTGRAAGMDHCGALGDLGVMYSNGWGTQSSFSKAAEAHEAAAAALLNGTGAEEAPEEETIQSIKEQRHAFEQNRKRVTRRQAAAVHRAASSVHRAHRQPPPRTADCPRSHLSSGRM